MRRAAPIALLCLALGASGCAASVDQATPTTLPWVTGLGGSLTVGIDQAPTGCNPNSATGDTWANDFVLAPVLPSAFVVSPSGAAIYDSAVITQAEVQNLSPQTVAYSINPKAVWSDGAPITSQDFVYAWQEQRGPTSASAPAPPDAPATTLGYRDIQSVTGSNQGRTVTVVFKNPFADWKMLFADLLPAHVMEKVGWDPPCTTVDPAIDLSGGPFEIAGVSGSREVTLVRNPHWWGQAADLARLVVRVGAGTRQLMRWLVNGTAQVIQPQAIDEQQLQLLGSRPGLDSNEQQSSAFLQLEFSALSPTTGNQNVRLALAHAIDRAQLVNSVVGWIDSYIVPSASHLYTQAQGAYPGPSPPPNQIAGQPNYNAPPPPASPTAADPFPLTVDLGAVATELGAAGYLRAPGQPWVGPNGAPLSIRMGVDTGDPWAAESGPILAEQLQDAGVLVTQVPYPDATSTGAALAGGAVDAALLPVSATPYPSESIAWYTPLLGPPGVDGSQDWMNYNDPSLNAVLTEASRQLNPVKASSLYAQADLMLWSTMIALPLFTEPAVLAWSSADAGIGLNPFGPSLLWYPQTWGIRVPPDSPDTAPP